MNQLHNDKNASAGRWGLVMLGVSALYTASIPVLWISGHLSPLSSLYVTVVFVLLIVGVLSALISQDARESARCILERKGLVPEFAGSASIRFDQDVPDSVKRLSEAMQQVPDWYGLPWTKDSAARYTK